MDLIVISMKLEKDDTCRYLEKLMCSKSGFVGSASLYQFPDGRGLSWHLSSRLAQELAKFLEDNGGSWCSSYFRPLSAPVIHAFRISE